jgi:hypothetical protein
MSEDESPPPRFCFPVSQMLIVTAILSFQVALILPAVNFARARNGEAPDLPWLHWLLISVPELFGWDSRISLIAAPCGVTLILAFAILVLRESLPRRIRKYFPFRKAKGREKPPLEAILDSRPAIITVILASIASSTLVVAASHVHADRTNRRPVVTWEGPLADLVPWLASIGWMFSVIGIIFGGYSLHRFNSKHNYLAVVGMALSLINFLATLIFLGAIYED